MPEDQDVFIALASGRRALVPVNVARQRALAEWMTSDGGQDAYYRALSDATADALAPRDFTIADDEEEPEDEE